MNPKLAPSPLPDINSAEFDKTRSALEQHPTAARSLLSPTSRALLYAMVRKMRPAHVVEIGTYAGGTSEILALALAENGAGTLHTVSPHDAQRFGPVFAAWPEKLRARTEVHEIDSMGFFMNAVPRGIKAGIVLVDGNHDYEYAAFDIWLAARIMVPGGLLFVDNISQPGPYMAVMDFLERNPNWQFCGERLPPPMQRPFDKHRYTIKETDFVVLQAPRGISIGPRPVTIGEIGWGAEPLNGFRLELMPSQSGGTLFLQCIFRAFGRQAIIEHEIEGTQQIQAGQILGSIVLSSPMKIEGDFLRRAAEPWFWWRGEAPISLASAPVPF